MGIYFRPEVNRPKYLLRMLSEVNIRETLRTNLKIAQIWIIEIGLFELCFFIKNSLMYIRACTSENLQRILYKIK